jgi:hypothetical protein
MPVVEPEGHLVKVGVQMLGAQVMVGAHNRPLEQRPDALNRVGVNVGLYPLFCTVVDRPETLEP